MTRSSSIGALALALALTGCSSPPRAEPATPNQHLVADVTAPPNSKDVF